ncbi:MAG: hypothetical protein ABNH53_14875 [Henriciella sp.]
MKKNISLTEFVGTFSPYGENVSEDTFVWKELGFDLDELQWLSIDLSMEHNWIWTSETDIGKYIPYESSAWTKTYWSPQNWADLKLRELYAFCRPYVETI